jgi:hypothetical protein
MNPQNRVVDTKSSDYEGKPSAVNHQPSAISRQKKTTTHAGLLTAQFPRVDG